MTLRESLKKVRPNTYYLVSKLGKNWVGKVNGIDDEIFVTRNLYTGHTHDLTIEHFTGEISVKRAISLVDKHRRLK